jgi:hypothetical protein
MKILALLVPFFVSASAPASPAYYRESLSRLVDLEAMSVPEVGLVQTGEAVKFFIDARVPGAEKVYFINGRFKEGGVTPDYVRYHYDFASRRLGIHPSLDDFNRETYFTLDEKRYFAGVLHLYEREGRPLLVFQLYPQDLGREGQLVLAARRIGEALHLPDLERAFLRTGLQQTTRTVESEMEELGFPVLDVPELLAKASYRCVHSGETVGFLRLHPRHPERLTKREIAVLERPLPGLPPVAGVVTETAVTVMSSLSLRAKEWGVPEIELHDASRALAQWADRPVRLKATRGGYSLTPIPASEVVAMDSSRPIDWQFTREALSFDELCPGDPASCLTKLDRFGGHASRIGLARAAVRAVSVNGVAFSAGWYQDLIGSGARTREDILATPVPATWLAEWRRKIRETLSGDRVVVRISAHPRDIADWEGQDRYRAVRARLDDMEKGDEPCREDAGVPALGCAVKLVFAELWLAPVRQDRARLGIPPDLVATGFSVEEEEEGGGDTVSWLTRLPEIRDVYGYFWSLRSGVLREEGVATFARDWEPEGFSLLSRAAQAYLTPQNGRAALHLAKDVERAYCRADATYYPGSDCRQGLIDPEKPKALRIDIRRGKDGSLKLLDLQEF